MGLATIPGVKSVLSVPIHLYGTKRFEKPHEEFLRIADDGSYIILTFANSEIFGDFSTNCLKNRFGNVFNITNIYFSGLHPDITYVGDRGGRLQSPIGDYHSKIVLHSYLTDRSAQQCRERFCGTEYSTIGYFDDYPKSADELLARDERNEIAFGRFFLDVVKKHPSLYTVNHPTGYVFQEYTCFIARRLGLKCVRFPIPMLPNYLANSAWWPIYPEIAEEHRLEYRTPMVFKQPDVLGGRMIGLDEFVNRSYENYDKQAERVRKTGQALKLLETWGHGI